MSHASLRAPGLDLLQDLVANLAVEVAPSTVIGRVTQHLRGSVNVADLVAGVALATDDTRRAARDGLLRHLAEALGRADGEQRVRDARRQQARLGDAAWMSDQARFARTLPVLPGTRGGELTEVYRQGLLAACARAHLLVADPDRVRAVDHELTLVLQAQNLSTAVVAVAGTEGPLPDPVLAPTEFARRHVNRGAMGVALDRVRAARLEPALVAVTIEAPGSSEQDLLAGARAMLAAEGDTAAVEAPVSHDAVLRAVQAGRQAAAMIRFAAAVPDRAPVSTAAESRPPARASRPVLR